MLQPITVSQGPTVSRGLVSVIGIGMDLGGPGASEWTQSPFADPLDPDSRWENGYRPVHTPCGRTTNLLPPALCGPGAGVDSGLATPPWAQGEPGSAFQVEGPSIECSTLGVGADSDDAALTRSAGALRDLLWRSIARELWTGEQSTASGLGNRYLADPAETVVVGEGLSPKTALFLLERAAGNCTSRDERILIHTPWAFLEALADEGLVESTPNSDRYWTKAGSLVVADVGYTGSAPGVTAEPALGAGGLTVWMYATTRLSVRLGKATSRQGTAPMSSGTAINAATNRVAVSHIQSALATWACCTFGASVTIGR